MVIQRVLRSRLLRIGFVVIAVTLCVVALARYGGQIRQAALDLSLWSVAGALIAGVAGTGFSLLAWRRTLAELGSPLPLGVGVRVFSLSQLGKYIPGSLWPFVAQVELGREHGVPARRSASAIVVSILVSLVSAALIAAALLPFAAGNIARGYWWALAAVPFLLAALHPAVLNRALNTLLRLARRPQLERPLTAVGIAAVAGWSACCWLSYGVHIFVLARDLGGSGASLLPASIGTYALAWSVGFLVVIAPAGAGVREVVLVAGLSGTLGRASVILLAVASRFLITFADLIWAGVGITLGRAHTRQVPDELVEADELRQAARRKTTDVQPSGFASSTEAAGPTEPAAAETTGSPGSTGSSARVEPQPGATLPPVA